MRWIWIDRILELERGKRCVALKNISACEDVLHDHFAAAGDRPAMPVMPNSLIIEGMAQTSGILVGHAGDFKEKVILAKITKARFSAVARPGFSIRHTANLDNYGPSGAATSGICELIDPATGQASPLARIDLMFSHIDQNRSGLAFPQENFVFTGALMDLLSRTGFCAAPNT